jgi:EAL domain-containing protein (putative c-di-GMP-specific phosphodiesterase class I)
MASAIAMGDVTDALDNYRFYFVYQPKFQLDTMTLIGFEALVRWIHPTAGNVSPLQLIVMLEAGGVMSRFTSYILVRAGALLGEWKHARHAGLSLSINLPASEITRPDMPALLAGIIGRFGFAPGQLEIELTETTAPGDLDVLDRAVQAIRDLGVTVSLDDFGAGYASMSLFSRLRLDAVKLDSSLVKQITENPDARLVVQTLVTLNRQLGRKTVVEGIETAAQLDWLCSLGELDGQGFALSPPLDLAHLPAYVSRCEVVRAVNDAHDGATAAAFGYDVAGGTLRHDMSSCAVSARTPS